MKIRLEEPVLLQSDSDSFFMIAEFIEINHETVIKEVSYHGKVYIYENPEVEFEYNGVWSYHLEEGWKTNKDKPFEE